MTSTITKRAYGRIGLLGNPSDGYNGRTIALSLENYFAEVTLAPSARISFTPHPEHDAQDFDSLNSLAERIRRNGYYGGIRLLWALCYRFHEYWEAASDPLPHRPFTLSYATTIPKQAGLSGSSAIITAALSCLEAHFQRRVPKALRPGLVLAAETELGITAGLMDRVIQTYDGLVFMDFNAERLKADGHGVYVPMDPSALPRLWLVWCDNPGDSGKVHSTVRRRYDEGDQEVKRLLDEVACLADGGRAALEAGDQRGLAALMDRNFDLRRALFGDAALGALNVAMVEVARSVGAAAKFTGSGGAAVALCPEGTAQEEALAAACAKAGFLCELVRVHRPAAEDDASS